MTLWQIRWGFQKRLRFYRPLILLVMLASLVGLLDWYFCDSILFPVLLCWTVIEGCVIGARCEQCFQNWLAEANRHLFIRIYGLRCRSVQ